jgi:hypothetical protein
MEKFQKLSRAEMKNVLGGEGGGCGSCVTSDGCSYADIGQIGCPALVGNYGEESSVCTVCTCNGIQYYPCQTF